MRPLFLEHLFLGQELGSLRRLEMRHRKVAREQETVTLNPSGQQEKQIWTAELLSQELY
jgi:hypothetical protein